MQKLINVLALTSFLVSATVVGAGSYVYMNRESLRNNIESQIKEGIKNALPGALGGSTGGVIGGASGGGLPVPNPVVPF